LKYLQVIMLLCLIIFTNLAVFAQEDDENDNPPEALAASAAKSQLKFFAMPIGEIVYSRTTPAFGGGVAIGSDNGLAIGARAVYLADSEGINSLEISVFLRFYFFGPEAYWGPFAQLNAGAIIFARDRATYIPADVGMLTASLNAGWRFAFGSNGRFFLEAAIRTGTPYFIGGGVSAGVRF